MDNTSREQAELLLQQRQTAREQREFAIADALRSQIEELGCVAIVSIATVICMSRLGFLIRLASCSTFVRSVNSWPWRFKELYALFRFVIIVSNGMFFSLVYVNVSSVCCAFVARTSRLASP